jgi:hypothetical protein
LVVAIAGPDDLSSGVRWGTLLCAAWLVGCGRIGFDAEGHGDAGAPVAGGPGTGRPGDGGVAADAALVCGPPCPSGQYCDTPLGMCSGPGTCAPILTMPGVCNDVIVCGCDGRQYPTPCDAERAGVSIAEIGPCTI